MKWSVNFQWLSGWFATKRGVKIAFVVFFLCFSVWFLFFSLPEPLFSDPLSTVLLDEQGKILSAKIAADEQWRIRTGSPPHDKFHTCLVAFEDQYFYRHPGINPIALLRALGQWIKNGKIVSGGSTLSMQVIRLSRHQPPRTIWEKWVEIILALRLELRYSKQEILQLYDLHAPFGGNIVGIQSACLKYLGRDAAQLSWGEAAWLAVLPNQPSLIFPGKNQQRLIQKRERLLALLLKKKVIDSLTYDLAQAEGIPENWQSFPSLARHVLEQEAAHHPKGITVASTINREYQISTENILQQHIALLSSIYIHNAAALIVSNQSGQVLAYVGNTQHDHDDFGNQVDIIKAPRSSGSILKPFLYAHALDDGLILSKTLLPDVPLFFGSFYPKNFAETYDGRVGADEALIRSLNIPFVYLLQDYQYPRFYEQIKKWGLQTWNHPSAHYGLSMILGGAEVNLWDLTLMYRNLYALSVGEPMTSITYKKDVTADPLTPAKPLSQAAAWLTLAALKELKRPDDELGWRYFQSAKDIRWKTGTSFGFRDAWAVGISADYTIGVWVGNADGEGRPGLTGIQAAAPVMFDIFNALPQHAAFGKQPPMDSVRTCAVTGFKAGDFCSETSFQKITPAGHRTVLCPFHRQVYVDETRRYKVHASCYEAQKMVADTVLVFSPLESWYYYQKFPTTRRLPKPSPGCASDDAPLFSFKYPQHHARVFIPTHLDGSQSQLIAEVVHLLSDATLYWMLDGKFLAKTKAPHTLAISLGEGEHTLSATDTYGLQRTIQFTVYDSQQHPERKQ